ncbi:MAG: GNAT family N-acetyltransferase [Rudanella sp.]|nr:GNAT family N-acetyltransferase [Rudanella sp.]
MRPIDFLNIRPATADDYQTIYSFLCDLEEMVLDNTAFRAIFRRNLTDSCVRYRVAEQNGEVVGFVSCHIQYLLHHTGRVGEIQELYVRPENRNQRIGHQLVAYLENMARSEGFVNLEVTTNQRRTDTIRFYEQTGFRLSHRKLMKVLEG